ncbi:MAG: class I SAM-dependent methyltransferase [Vicinamibacterales bacterium]|jgi:SAM-dependent methyltransferase
MRIAVAGAPEAMPNTTDPSAPLSSGLHRSPVSGRPVYIWGAGQVGLEARRLLRDRNLCGFLDQASGRWGSTVEGLPVADPRSVLHQPARPFVVIASMYETQIAEQLVEAGWMAGADFATVASLATGDGERSEDVFSRIFHTNSWRDAESVSGGGSSLGATRRVRDALPALLQQYGVRSILDAPCGDVNWMAELLPSLDHYTGVDIVAPLIARNAERFAAPRVTFLHRDIAVDALPSADLIICRDCLVHLPNHVAADVLRNFARTSSTYLLSTTFPDSGRNHDVITGAWRPVDLRQPPFGLPAPLETIAEKAPGPDGLFADKALALWRFDTIRASLSRNTASR